MKLALSVSSVILIIYLIIILVGKSKQDDTSSASASSDSASASNTQDNNNVNSKILQYANSLKLIVPSPQVKLLQESFDSIALIRFDLKAGKQIAIGRTNSIIQRIAATRINAISKKHMPNDSPQHNQVFGRCQAATELLADFKVSLDKIHENTDIDNPYENTYEPLVQIEVGQVDYSKEMEILINQWDLIIQSLRENNEKILANPDALSNNEIHSAQLNIANSCSDTYDYAYIISSRIRELRGHLTQMKLGSVPMKIQLAYMETSPLAGQLVGIGNKEFNVKNCDSYADRFQCTITIKDYRTTSWIKNLLAVPFEIDGEIYQVNLKKKDPVMESNSGLVAEAKRCLPTGSGNLHCTRTLDFHMDACVKAIFKDNIKAISINCNFIQLQQATVPFMYGSAGYHIIARRSLEPIDITVGKQQIHKTPIVLYHIDDATLKYNLMGYTETVVLKGNLKMPQQVVQTLAYSDNVLRFFLKRPDTISEEGTKEIEEKISLFESSTRSPVDVEKEKLENKRWMETVHSTKAISLPDVREPFDIHNDPHIIKQEPQSGPEYVKPKSTVKSNNKTFDPIEPMITSESWSWLRVIFGVGVVIQFLLVLISLCYWFYKCCCKNTRIKNKAIEDARTVVLADTMLLNQQPSKTRLSPVEKNRDTRMKDEARYLLRKAVKEQGSEIEKSALLGAIPKHSSKILSNAEIILANTKARNIAKETAYLNNMLKRERSALKLRKERSKKTPPRSKSRSLRSPSTLKYQQSPIDLTKVKTPMLRDTDVQLNLMKEELSKRNVKALILESKHYKYKNKKSSKN